MNRYSVDGDAERDMQKIHAHRRGKKICAVFIVTPPFIITALQENQQ
jgi:hypothetical protein